MYGPGLVTEGACQKGEEGVDTPVSNRGVIDDMVHLMYCLKNFVLFSTQNA